MFKIKESTIHCSRGDSGTISLKIPYVDVNDYIKYEDNEATPNVYWYDSKNEILYDSDYEESSVSLDTLHIVFYQFQVDDKITFNIYNKNGYDAEPILSKDIIVDATAYSVDIPLTEEEMTFGEISNKPVTYWYDITLNEDATVVCYNENGAKEFIQYPAKGDEE